MGNNRNDHIGQWVRREEEDDGSDDSPSKWHLVESTIGGAAITKCGRRMEPSVDGAMLMWTDTMPLTRVIGQPQLCKAGCDRSGD